MYSFSPPPEKSRGIAFSILSLVLSAAFFVTAARAGDVARILLNCLGICVIGVSVLIIPRAFFTVYTYTLERTETPGEYDLVVTERIGKAVRTVCRVGASGGTLSEERGKKTVRIYSYRPALSSYATVYFEPREADGEYMIAFCPDDEMKRLMYMLQ